MDVPEGNDGQDPDADENDSEKQKRPIRAGLMACQIELFLLTLTVADKFLGLLDHWVS